jgi:hypothetical protein
VPGIKKDEQGRSSYIYELNTTLYGSRQDTIIQISEQQYFRYLPIVHVKFYPISYDYTNQTLKLIRSVRITFTFEGGQKQGRKFFPASRIDHLYEKLILNFNQAKNWLTPKPRRLAKQAATFDGPWYRIEVDTDGLYKITRSVLNSAGVDVSNLDPRTLKIFNHGGKPLTVSTAGIDSDPLQPAENAIFVNGEEDGSFDLLNMFNIHTIVLIIIGYHMEVIWESVWSAFQHLRPAPLHLIYTLYSVCILKRTNIIY